MARLLWRLGRALARLLPARRTTFYSDEALTLDQVEPWAARFDTTGPCGGPSCTHHVYDTDGRRADAPHCDASVLHAPGECVYCDHYPDWQAYRRLARIAFTGQPPGGDADLAPCPSDYRRGRAGAHVWGGNQPQPPGSA